MSWASLRHLLDIELVTVAGTVVTGATVISLILLIAGGYVLSRVVRSAATHALRLRGKAVEGRIETVLRLVHYVIVGTALLAALDTVGIQLSALFAAGAIFAVGLGFAMQTIAQNFVAGVILMAEGVIKSGDILELDGRIVRVGQMGIRATVARTQYDEELIIPNSVLVQSTVKNLTHHDRIYRIPVTVGVAYSSDMRRVEETLGVAAAGLPWRLQDRPPRVLLTDFGASSVDWEVSVWMDDPWDARMRASALRMALWLALKDAGITIAYPQLDVHLDAAVEAALRTPPGE